MTDATQNDPTLEQTVDEVQGHFPNSAALEDAIGQLTLTGFDRADFSLPEDQSARPVQTPDGGAENPIDEIDKSQLRTMGTSMAGYAGAIAAAGATLATGGAAALALAAAAAVGAGSALTANAIGTAANHANTDDRDARGRAGTLILAVRVTRPDQVAAVSAIMTQAGAIAVAPVSRGGDMLTKGISAASWTGA